MTAPEPPLGAAAIERAFDAPEPLTVGLEEELMLLDPTSHGLRPCAHQLLERVRGDPRFRIELPAAQFEIVVPPCGRVDQAVARLAAARNELADAADGLAELAAAGVHPTAPAEGELNPDPRYEHTAAQFGPIARRQLVFSLQVHVAPGGAAAALAVYNALRSYLPELAALAANAPFHEGRDTGLASVRPKIAESLPRQGVPPPIGSWAEHADGLAWGAASGAVPKAGVWWWELRPHPGFGTLELRVPDAQSTIADAGAVAALAHALVGWLTERHVAGERLAVDPSWRIAENRWRAARDGAEATLADLRTGEPRPARGRLHELVDLVGPTARRLGCERELEGVAALIAENGAMRQRAVASERGIAALPAWLAGRYLEGVGGEPENSG